MLCTWLHIDDKVVTSYNNPNEWLDGIRPFLQRCEYFFVKLIIEDCEECSCGFSDGQSFAAPPRVVTVRFSPQSPMPKMGLNQESLLISRFQSSVFFWAHENWVLVTFSLKPTFRLLIVDSCISAEHPNFYYEGLKKTEKDWGQNWSLKDRKGPDRSLGYPLSRTENPVLKVFGDCNHASSS